MLPISSCFEERNETVSDADFEPLSVTKNGVVPRLENVALTNSTDNRKLVRRGDFVINSRSDRKGSSGISPLDGSVSVVYTVLTPRYVISARYAHHLLRSTAFQEEFYRWGSGIVADLWSTRYSTMKSISIPVPPQSEQKVIADYLDRETAQIDKLIAKQEQLIATLRERRVAAISAAVTPNFGESGADDWFGSAPDGWRIASLKQHFEIALGKMINGNTLSGDEEQAPYLAAGSIQPDHLVADATKTMPFTPSELAKYSLLCDDIVVVEGGAGYGRSHRLTRDLPGWGFQNHVARLRSSSALVSSRFATYVLKACVASGYVEANNRTATLPSLSRDVLGAIRFIYPATDEQQRICDALDQRLAASDALIAKAERFIELSKERRAALITAAVTGQLEIPA
ncbi:restriction endonuclease subunit S [Microbacterium sp. ARD32]|uniref:restriction endonuclease subunit S n=1 Tax=Microbacterium sp. ARD32 TaxID=2962577 RepID=UPI002880D656|nr:restriction endonuclease subunit S [Microbacterium sp. ARD32]MDT0158645.1 restriction endonuclease subunit S [Microbacterium sp. ARD32]